MYHRWEGPVGSHNGQTTLPRPRHPVTVVPPPPSECNIALFRHLSFSSDLLYVAVKSWPRRQNSRAIRDVTRARNLGARSVAGVVKVC